MSTTQQPEALRLADALEQPGYGWHSTPAQCAAELRRLHAENASLRAGYDAARLEIESLRGRGVEPAVDWSQVGMLLDAHATTRPFVTGTTNWAAAICRYMTEHAAQPAPACLTCNDHGAVGNILTAEPCPDCTRKPAPAAVAGPSEILEKVDTLIASINEAHISKDAEWKRGCFAAADSVYEQIKEMLAAAPTTQPAPQQEAREPVAPTDAELLAAHDMGAKGSLATDRERLLFEAWMRGHCWALSAQWDGSCYRGSAEHGGYVCPRAMNTRQLWAAWRDRAALAAAPQPSPASQGDALTQAARDVLAERQRQISAEGWTPEHDDEHVEGELCLAAAGYAVAASDHIQAIATGIDDSLTMDDDTVSPPHTGHPWPAVWTFKPCQPRRALVKSGALVLAELERLDRAALAAKGGA